jgi:hypothetical protein
LNIDFFRCRVGIDFDTAGSRRKIFKDSAHAYLRNSIKQDAGKCGLSYAGINRGQVQRVSLSLKTYLEAPLAFTDKGAKLKENDLFCKPAPHCGIYKNLINQKLLFKDQLEIILSIQIKALLPLGIEIKCYDVPS